MVSAEIADLPEDSAHVFLSYSRKDREQAQKISDVLKQRHFGVFKDTDDILPTEEWRGRLEQLIHEADTIVFLLSPSSIASEVCAWEIDLAASLNKRIAPIVIEDVDTDHIPPLLAQLNFIFCTARDRFDDAVDSLVSALNTDIDWIREHTRLNTLAGRWEKAGRPARFLLRGQDIADAESWRDTQPREAPAVTNLHASFITASRRVATKRQRMTVTFSLAGMIAALGLAGFAYLQREAAIENEQRAVTAQALAEQQRNEAQVNQSLLLTRLAGTALTQDRPVEAALLALEGLPDPQSVDATKRDRPLVDAAQVMLRKSKRKIIERKIVAALKAPIDEVEVSHKADLAIMRASRTGETVAVGLKTLEQLYSLQADRYRSGTNRIVLSPDGQQMAALASNGELRILDARTGKEKQRITLASGAGRLIGFNSAENLVIVHRGNGNVAAISLDTQKNIYQIEGQTAAVSPDGNRLGVVRQARLELFDAKTGETIHQDTRDLKGPLNAANRLTFSPDGRRIAASSDHVTWVYDGRLGPYLASTGNRKQSQLAVSFSGDGDWLAIGAADGRTIIYDLGKRSIVGSYGGLKSWNFDVKLSADKQTVLSTGANGELHVWDPIKKALISRARGHTAEVTKGYLIRDDSMALSVSADGTARVWDLPNRSGADRTLVEEFRGKPVYSRDGQTVALSGAGLFRVQSGAGSAAPPSSDLGPKYLAFSRSGDRLLGLHRDPETGRERDICFYDGLTGAEKRCILAGRAEAIVWHAYIDDAAKVVAGNVMIDGASMISSHDGETGEQIGRLPLESKTLLSGKGFSPTTPTVSPDGKRIYVQRTDNEILVLDVKLSKEISPRIRASKNDSKGAVFLHDRGHVAFFWANGSVEILNIDTGKVAATYALKIAPYSDIHPSPSGRYLSVKTADGNLILADSMTGQTVLELALPGQNPMERPVFSSDERYVLASRDATTAVWDLRNGRKLETFSMDFGKSHPSVFVKGFSPDTKHIATWSWTGVKRWSFRPDPLTLIIAARSDISRCLSPAQRKAYSLPPEPPRWCITGPGLQMETNPENWRPKWPFVDRVWRDWQIHRDKGEAAELPG